MDPSCNSFLSEIFFIPFSEKQKKKKKTETIDLKIYRYYMKN